MAPHRLRVLISSAFSLAVLAAAIGQAPAVAEPLPYGPDTCIDGYVWRDGRPGDHVCVTPAVRDATAQQNADGAVNREPNGGEYGPNTCKQGFVWREAFGGDAVCVTPDVRDQARADNGAAESRKLANQAQPPVDPRSARRLTHRNRRMGRRPVRRAKASDRTAPASPSEW